jgi:hypothetical protein
MPHDLNGVKEIAASRNFISIVDAQNKVWIWSAQNSQGNEDLKITGMPKIVEALR